MESDFRHYVINANQYPDGTRPVSPQELGRQYGVLFARVRGYHPYIDETLFNREDFRAGVSESYQKNNHMFTGYATIEELEGVSL